jgi:hypothetical protein
VHYLRLFLFFVFAGAFILIIVSYDAKSHNWRTASRESVGIAPDPAITTEAVIQVYGARAFSWRGYFGIHTWIAVKPTDAMNFTVYEVLGCVNVIGSRYWLAITVRRTGVGMAICLKCWQTNGAMALMR